jgi:hypothetical protein
MIPALSYRSTTIRILSKHFNLPCEVMICIWQRCALHTRLCLANSITRISRPYLSMWDAMSDWIAHGHLSCLQWLCKYLQAIPTPSCASTAIYHDQAHIIEWLLQCKHIDASRTWLGMAEGHRAHKCAAVIRKLLDESDYSSHTYHTINQ